MTTYNVYIQSHGVYTRNINSKEMHETVRDLIDSKTKGNIVVYNDKNSILFLSSYLSKKEKLEKLQNYYDENI